MDNLKEMYREMAGLTEPHCARGEGECKQFEGRKYRCCSRSYCEMAREFAKREYGVELRETGNGELPFMGESGCVVEPWLRPICTLHVCSITWAARSWIGGDEETRRYFGLRERILAGERLAGHRLY